MDQKDSGGRRLYATRRRAELGPRLWRAFLRRRPDPVGPLVDSTPGVPSLEAIPAG